MVKRLSRAWFLALLVGASAQAEEVSNSEESKLPAADVLSSQAAESTVRLEPLLAVGLPQPLSVGLRFRRSAEWDWETEGGIFSTDLSDRTLAVSHVRIGGRWHPWASGLTVGARLGYQSYEVSGVLPITETQGSIRLTSWYVAPTLGFEWRVGKSLTVGSDLGWQVSLHSVGSLYDDGVRNTRDSLRRIAGLPIPTLSLLRLGWTIDL